MTVHTCALDHLIRSGSKVTRVAPPPTAPASPEAQLSMQGAHAIYSQHQVLSRTEAEGNQQLFVQVQTVHQMSDDNK